MSEPQTRIRRLRDARGWSQREMGDYLRVAQPTIARLEGGQDEPGPIAKLLDQLEERGVEPSHAVTLTPAATAVTETDAGGVS